MLNSNKKFNLSSIYKIKSPKEILREREADYEEIIEKVLETSLDIENQDTIDRQKQAIVLKTDIQTAWDEFRFSPA
jgi:phosphoenolpyruvate-protein kinase (PTS system EI component)